MIFIQKHTKCKNKTKQTKTHTKCSIRRDTLTLQFQANSHQFTQPRSEDRTWRNAELCTLLGRAPAARYKHTCQVTKRGDLWPSGPLCTWANSACLEALSYKACATLKMLSCTITLFLSSVWVQSPQKLKNWWRKWGERKNLHLKAIPKEESFTFPTSTNHACREAAFSSFGKYNTLSLRDILFFKRIYVLFTTYVRMFSFFDSYTVHLWKWFGNQQPTLFIPRIHISSLLLITDHI